MHDVLFIAYYFPPIGGAGVQRSVKFVRYLPESGYRPIVVTGPGSSEDRWTPKDAALTKEVPSDTTVYRTLVPQPAPDTRSKRRVNAWLGMPGSFAKWWVPSIIKVGEEALKRENPRIIFATMSPFESAIAAGTLSKRHAIPWVADLRDPWALDEMKVYTSRVHRWMDEKRMFSALSSASAIVMNTPEATEALVRRFPTLGNRIVTTITNGYDAEDFASELPARHDGKFRIVHSGYLHTEMGMELRRKKIFHRFLGGAADGVDILTRSHFFLLKAIEGWIAEDPSVAGEIELVFVGATTQGDERITQDGKLQEIIRFTGYLPHDKSVEMIRTADLLFLPMHNLPPGRRSTIVPGKTYEYMATGKPILAAVPDGDAKEFLGKSGNAYFCKPNDHEAMQGVLKQVYRDWKTAKEGVRQNNDYVCRFERRILTSQLAQLFKRVAGH